MLSALSLFRKQRYKSFSEEVNGRKLISRSYKGTRPIDVNKVVGSVGRCRMAKRNVLINIPRDTRISKKLCRIYRFYLQLRFMSWTMNTILLMDITG